MAELIPLEYRIAVSQRQLLRRWGFVAALAVAVATGGLITAWRWQRHQYQEYQGEKLVFDHQSIIKVRAKVLIDQRDAIAERMARLEGVQNDQIMLQLIQNVTREFTDDDLLEEITLEVHSKDGGERNPPGSFRVTINGVTRSNTSLSSLNGRLAKASAKATPAMLVQPGSNHQTTIMDGKAVQFQVVFERSMAKLPDVSTAEAH